MGFLTFLHVFAAVILVVAILMQAGRGGGLAEGFSTAENLLGPQTNKLMVKVTAVLAVLFLSLAVLLAFLNSRQQHSLMADLPEGKRRAAMDIDKLFSQPANQVIQINAAAPSEGKTAK